MLVFRGKVSTILWKTSKDWARHEGVEMAREEFLKPFRLSEILRAEISEFKPHDPIPRERQLAERFGVSRVCVRQALAILNDDVVIYTIHGSGSFVSPARVTKQMKLLSFTDEMASIGLSPTTKVLRISTLAPRDKVLEEWITIAEPTYRIERLRLGNNEPMSLDITFVTESIAPGLDKKDLTKSLYGILKEEYGQEIVSADEQLIPVLISKENAEKLSVPTESAAFEIHRHGFNNRGIQIESTRILRRGDRWDFKYTVKV